MRKQVYPVQKPLRAKNQERKMFRLRIQKESRNFPLCYVIFGLNISPIFTSLVDVGSWITR